MTRAIRIAQLLQGSEPLYDALEVALVSLRLSIMLVSILFKILSNIVTSLKKVKSNTTSPLHRTT